MIRIRPRRRWPGFRSRGGRGLIADRCQQGFKDEVRCYYIAVQRGYP
jgi:hypothetical protein